MEHQQSHEVERDAALGGTRGNLGHRQANIRPVNHTPPVSNGQVEQSSSTPHLQSSQTPQASQQNHRSDDIQRLREAQAAFSANAGIIATTPRQTAWQSATHPIDALAAPEDAQIPGPSSLHNDAPGSALPDAKVHRDRVWTPSLALGSTNASMVGAREAARQHLSQWDRIYEYNTINNPGSVQTVEKHRTKARLVYEELCASERDEDVLPLSELSSYRNERIRARTTLLSKTLNDAAEEGCEPMKKNITAALQGYNTDAIGFSDCYTLIYAGQIVDTTARTHAEFTVDRQERLDRYFEQHGPGYLWWEPPLLSGRGQVLAKKGLCLNLERQIDSLVSKRSAEPSFQDDATYYKVPLGFKKDDSLRRRVRSSRRRSVVVKDVHTEPDDSSKRKSKAQERTHDENTGNKRQKQCTAGEDTSMTGKDTSAQKFRAKGLTVSIPSDQDAPSAAAAKRKSEDRDTETPRVQTASPPAATERKSDTPATDHPTIFFDMLLDSGAELPVLLHDDFDMLGFTKQDMNAASVVELSAAAGQGSAALCFELLVGLELKGSSSTSWVEQMVYTESRFFPCRVIKLPSAVQTPDYGAFSNDRLSGMLPFLAYYTASAPGNERIWLGEKRAEVLRTENLPAGLGYDPYNNPNTGERFRKRAQVSKIRQLGGGIRGLRKVTLETEMEGGTILIDEEVISQGSEEIVSSIKIVNKDGHILSHWQQGSHCAKSRSLRK